MKDTQLAQITLTDDSTGAIANPIHLSTAYKHPKLVQSTGFDYTRTKILHAQHLKPVLPNLSMVLHHSLHQVECQPFN